MAYVLYDALTGDVVVGSPSVELCLLGVYDSEVVALQDAKAIRSDPSAVQALVRWPVYLTEASRPFEDLRQQVFDSFGDDL